MAAPAEPPAAESSALGAEAAALLLPRPVAPPPLPFRYTRAVAPMVGLSDVAFRLLCRRYGCDVAYTQMIHADRYTEQAALYHELHPHDRPLIVQLAGHDPASLLAAARAAVARGCDAVDLNLGCPQSAAREGRYGAWLTDKRDWPLCRDIVATMAAGISPVPVTVKIRLQQTVSDTVAFAQVLVSAGARLVAVHGRQRGSERHRRAGPADLQAIAAVQAALLGAGVPVVANGNLRCHADVHANVSATGCVALMSGEGLLREPTLFHCPTHQCDGNSSSGSSRDSSGADEVQNAILRALHRHFEVVSSYLALAEELRTREPVAAAHVAWMLGREGHGERVRYRYRGGLAHHAVRAALYAPGVSYASIRSVVAAVLAGEEARIKGIIIVGDASGGEGTREEEAQTPGDDAHVDAVGSASMPVPWLCDDLQEAAEEATAV